MIINSSIHPSVKIWHPELVNIYGSTIGEGTKIASFVEIGNSKIGNYCKIEAFSFLPPGTVIEDYVFIGPHVIVTNDRYPDAKVETWKSEPVTVKKGASIGAGSVLVSGVIIGENALIGAGSVVSRDVPAGAVVYGEKANQRRQLGTCKP
jgi:UDP-2-acetamido-3-amino-2,3-dideoxy-glucuronate N-acetyltransferase